MLRRSLSLALLPTVFATSASANALQDNLGKASCWQRIYDDTHLASHPRQAVERVRLSTETQDDGTMWASIGFNLRKRLDGPSDALDYAIAGICEADGDAIVCSPEWDAGSFVLEAGPGGALRVRNLKLIVNPAGYAAEELAPDAADLSKSDDAVWLLPALDDPACRVY